jgi:hypothetical protein
MKYLTTPMPGSIALPEHGLFESRDIDLIASLSDTMSKESFDGLINNHRNAFAYFGIDFTQDVADFFGTDATTAINILHAISTDVNKIQVAAADELIGAPRLMRAFSELLAPVAKQYTTQADPSWVDRLGDPASAQAQIVTAMAIYLATPGARVEHVLKSGGFNDTTSDIDAQSIEMPRIFTQLFDDAPLGSPLRTEINTRLNEQIYNPNRDGTGYSLAQDFTFEITNADPTKNMSGFLQYAEVHSSGDNPITNGMAFDGGGTKQSVSAHTGAVAYGAIGAQTITPRKIQDARDFAEGKGLLPLDKDGRDGGAWRMFTNVDRTSAARWRTPTPGEAARRELAHDAVVQFRQPLTRTENHGWSTTQRNTYDQLTVDIVTKLGLASKQKGLVDFWVRQMLGAPAGTDKDGKDVGWVSGQGAIEVAHEILWNVENHYLPTVSAMVPLLHTHDLQMIYRANRGKEDGWSPRQSIAGDSLRATQWKQWTEVSLGSALTSDNLFDRLYLLALDGFMHTYQDSTQSLLDLPVSMDALVSQKLLDPETNDLLVSLESNTELLAKDPVLLDMTRATLDELIGGRRLATGFEAKAAPASEIAKRRERIRAWRKETGTPIPVDVTMKNFRKNGDELINKSTSSNALYRMLINLRVGTALINPALYVSMGPEQWVRGSLDRLANMVTGSGTVGATAQAQSRITARAEAKTQQRYEDRVKELTVELGKATTDTERERIQEEIDRAPRVGALEAVGLTHRYSPEQLKKLKTLYGTLGRRNDFKAMIYRDLFYLRPHEHGPGRVESWLENYAKLGSRMQDPTYGMHANTMARRYLEAALQHIEATPTLHVMTVDQLIAEMSTDPEFLKSHFPTAHEAGSNAIAQIRSLKPTPISLFLRGVYEPMSESSNMGYSFIGNVVLKIPLLFSGYAVNVATTILGLQGASDMTAMFLQGRQKGPNSLLGRAQAALRGQKFSPEDDANFDMSSVLEGIDLSRSFIRGGLTHTGLFAFGMMAGGLGLSGEDDESKKRRKMSKLQGVPYIYDPRSVENDFRNADAIYLDWLPFGMDAAFRSDAEDARSMYQPSWMIRQFISPIMGMERFYETGDFRHITWGFQDAVGAFPLINKMFWSDAVETASDLVTMADKEGQGPTPSHQVESMGLMTQAVGVYERMLFENAFVNALYIGKDRYDRDPYVLPLRDSDGTLQRDIEGEARAQDLSVEQYIEENRDKLTREIAGGKWEGQLYIDENSEIKQGYLTRDGKSATLHSLTENRATMATVLSLFDGLSGGGFGNSDYWRYNMPIKTREFDKSKVTQEEAEAYILGAFKGQNKGGEQVQLSAEEIGTLIKADYKARGEWIDYAIVDQMAMEAAKQQGPALLSMIENGREKLTKDGARAVYSGLAHGSVKFGDAALVGLHIPFEMREQIQKEWMADIIQEGVNIGLDQTKATSRMKRLWYGPTSDPSVVGLGDLLWSKDISYEDTLKFNQLNTTYVMGPDGMPWATGWERAGLMGALGLKPLQKPITSEQSMTGNDERLNTTFLGGQLGGMNTGLRALEVIDKSRYVPTDVEIGKAIEDAIREAAKQEYTPFTPYASSGGGNGWRNFGRGGYRRYGSGGGYGGGGGGGGFHNFTRLYALPHARAPYGDSIPFINTSNPLIRRADIRRERVWSERGRLKQWQ